MKKQDKSSKKNAILTCSFCGRNYSQVPIVPGNDGNICVDCAKKVNEIIDDASGQLRERSKRLPPTPSAKEIKEFLDRYVIGHDDVKKVLSVAVHNHYRRLEAKEEKSDFNKNPAAIIDEDDVEIEKSNILLIGPTGTGKTLMEIGRAHV